jgi:hypothetical protein
MLLRFNASMTKPLNEGLCFFIRALIFVTDE